MPSPLKFNGEALVWWAEPDVTISVPWYLGLMFRTRHRVGTLLKADAGESSRINLLVRRRWTELHVQLKLSLSDPEDFRTLHSDFLNLWFLSSILNSIVNSVCLCNFSVSTSRSQETSTLWWLITCRPVLFQLSSSHLSFQVFVGVKRVALLDFHQTRVDDGEWHHVLMELKSSKDGKNIKYMADVSLDYGLFQVKRLNIFKLKTWLQTSL